MTYISEAFKRMNLNQIRSFILYGTEDFATDTQPYRSVLKNESQPIRRRLELLYPDSKERDEAVGDLTQALSAYEAVYMELGMKTGARLIWQLLLSDEQQPPERS